MQDTFTITDLAEEFGITPRTIRFYEDQGLLAPGRCGLNRVYSRRDRGRLILILRGKRVGFSLKEISEMLDLYDLGDGQIEQARALVKRSRQRIAALKQQRQEIDTSIADLEAGCKAAEKLLRTKGVGVPTETEAVEEVEAHGL